MGNPFDNADDAFNQADRDFKNKVNSAANKIEASLTVSELECGLYLPQTVELEIKFNDSRDVASFNKALEQKLTGKVKVSQGILLEDGSYGLTCKRSASNKDVKFRELTVEEEYFVLSSAAQIKDKVRSSSGSVRDFSFIIQGGQYTPRHDQFSAPSERALEELIRIISENDPNAITIDRACFESYLVYIHPNNSVIEKILKPEYDRIDRKLTEKYIENLINLTSYFQLNEGFISFTIKSEDFLKNLQAIDEDHKENYRMIVRTLNERYKSSGGFVKEQFPQYDPNYLEFRLPIDSIHNGLSEIVAPNLNIINKTETHTTYTTGNLTDKSLWQILQSIKILRTLRPQSQITYDPGAKEINITVSK